MKFPCTSCGACCMNAWADYYIQKLGWVQPNGMCEKYVPETKQCSIYDSRPESCVVSKRFPDISHWQNVYNYCDEVHLKFYGKEREQEGECEHELKKNVRDVGS